MIFRWFESLIDAFKDPRDGMPPKSVSGFYLFYLARCGQCSPPRSWSALAWP